MNEWLVSWLCASEVDKLYSPRRNSREEVVPMVLFFDRKPYHNGRKQTVLTTSDRKTTQ